MCVFLNWIIKLNRFYIVEDVMVFSVLSYLVGFDMVSECRIFGLGIEWM